MKKYLSYSEMNQWYRDRDKYEKIYIEGEEWVSTPQQELGTLIHKAIEDKHYNWLKEAPKEKVMVIREILDKVKRPAESEVMMFADFARVATPEGDKIIKLMGIIDGMDKANRELDEYKTGRGKYWNENKVHADEQLSFYALMYYQNFHQFFKEMRLNVLDTDRGTVKVYKTVRSKADIIPIWQKVLRCYVEMKQAGIWEKRLSRKERQELNKPKLV